MATKKAGGTTKNGRDSAGRRLGVKRYGHRQPLSKIQITKILSKDGKVVSEMKKDTVKLSIQPKIDKKSSVKKEKTAKKIIKTKGKK